MFIFLPLLCCLSPQKPHSRFLAGPLLSFAVLAIYVPMSPFRMWKVLCFLQLRTCEHHVPGVCSSLVWTCRFVCSAGPLDTWGVRSSPAAATTNSQNPVAGTTQVCYRTALGSTGWSPGVGRLHSCQKALEDHRLLLSQAVAGGPRTELAVTIPSFYGHHVPPSTFRASRGR